jgi:hypothetical protein
MTCGLLRAWLPVKKPCKFSIILWWIPVPEDLQIWKRTLEWEHLRDEVATPAWK